MVQQKRYKAGMTPKGGGPKVKAGSQQGTTAKKQSDHSGKNRSSGNVSNRNRNH